MKKILWIEDDYYAIKGLVYPLEKDGYQIESARSALDGYRKARNWVIYDLIVIDLILPVSIDGSQAPNEFADWENEQYVGVELLKAIIQDLHVDCPILILSVVRDPIQTFRLEMKQVRGSLHKRGLLPSQVREQVEKILGGEGTT